MRAYDQDRNEEALQLMQQCAESGDPVACYLVAFWYSNGEGAPVNLKCSAEWLHRHEILAEGGNSEAQWEMGQHFRFGNLLSLNIDRANYWLELAAENGWGAAQHHLAWYLETGQYGYAQDKQAAEQWYQLALMQDHPETLYTFALREFKGGQITEKAISLLRRAADKGFKQAEHVLHTYTQ